METEKIKQILKQRIEIVENDLKGVDEDVNIHGELDDYKEGFKAALEWILNEIPEEENTKTFCKACGKETKNGNEFCTPEEGRNWTYTDDPERDEEERSTELAEEEQKEIDKEEESSE